MVQTGNYTERATQIFAALADEAWHQVAFRPLAELTVIEIAQKADIEAGLAMALQVTRSSSFWVKWQLDDQAVLESFADIVTLVPCIREKIWTLLHRFEAMRHTAPK